MFGRFFFLIDYKDFLNHFQICLNKMGMIRNSKKFVAGSGTEINHPRSTTLDVLVSKANGGFKKNLLQGALRNPKKKLVSGGLPPS